ncbi:MAG: palindromic element RPE1 domain-containing protein [Amoebophilaceae bacterium]|nr:palindromic element RPE1 domain-containing protein [Amoebophilaceae bacterium]
MQHFPCRRLIAHILLFSHLLSSCGSPSHWRVREETPLSSQTVALQAPLQAVEAVELSRSLKMHDKRQSAENLSILNIAHPLLPSATTLHFKQDRQGCFVVIGDQQLPVIFESGFTADHLVGSNAVWQEEHIHPYPLLGDNNNRALVKCAYGEEFTGATERRTGAYSNVREDSSTGATHKFFGCG